MAIRPRPVKFQGGPWAGKTIMTRLGPGKATMDLKVGEHQGTYKFGDRYAEWEPKSCA
jgi:hypothetical protein